MIKVSRQGYKQDIRLLCITNERIYNITRKNPSVKEVLLLADLVGITCTPLEDGFVCLHTKEADDDRVRQSVLAKGRSLHSFVPGGLVDGSGASV